MASGWARDAELFAALLAGQASVEDPLMLVTSTVGRRKSGPLWTIQVLAEGGDPAVGWRWSGENRSPLVTRDFLARQRRILLPTQYAREHQNQWVDAADSFTSAAVVDAAMGQGWHELLAGRRDVDAVIFVDLGTVRDPSVIGLGWLREELLNLSYEVGPQGIKVLDKGKVHQDHAVAVRGIAAALAADEEAAADRMAGLHWAQDGARELRRAPSPFAIRDHHWHDDHRL